MAKTEIFLEEEMAQALRHVASKEGRTEGEVIREALALYRIEVASRSKPFTPRQTEVLRLIAEGLSNSEIAQRMKIHESTVRSHVSSILTKLGVRRRSEAAILAERPRPLPKGLGAFHSGRPDVSSRAEELLLKAARQHR